MGDAAGIGPEIIAGVWQQIAAHEPFQAIVYGNPEIMRRAVALRKGNEQVREFKSRDELPQNMAKEEIPCIPCGEISMKEFTPGKTNTQCGEAAYQAIIKAIDDARNGTIDAVVTAPIHKGALNLAGHHYPGHTEIFAQRCGIDDFAMMLYLGSGDAIASPAGLAVVHVTLHTAMKNVFEQITIDSVWAKAKLAHNFMTRIIGAEGPRPRIGVCSLNPHAGEDGLFGDEEIRIIRPAVEQGQKEGLLLEGPFPADTIMINAKNGQYDAVVAMFHDQGHIALKLLGMHQAVNITLGLPIIRTSVAHGTAFDKAWNGTAQTGSLIEAIRVAQKLCASSPPTPE